MTDAPPFCDRNRPGHDQLRPGPRRQRGRQRDPSRSPFPRSSRPARSQPAPCCLPFSTSRADAEFPAGALALPWYPSARDVVGHLRPGPGRLDAAAPRLLGQELAVPRRRRSPRRDPARGAPPTRSPRSRRSRPRPATSPTCARPGSEAHPDAPLAEQDVVLTVPASFDAVARELTMEAATLAGFDEPPRLLEEPQAAMYDWLAQRGAGLAGRGRRRRRRSGRRCRRRHHRLLPHRGARGGRRPRARTGRRRRSHPARRRQHGSRARLHGEGPPRAGGQELDDWQMRALTHALPRRQGGPARRRPDPAEADAHPLAIPGRGSKLVGGTIRTELRRDRARGRPPRRLLPEVAADAAPQAPRRAGLTTLGLPYPADAGDHPPPRRLPGAEPAPPARRARASSTPPRSSSTAASPARRSCARPDPRGPRHAGPRPRAARPRTC